MCSCDKIFWHRAVERGVGLLGRFLLVAAISAEMQLFHKASLMALEIATSRAEAKGTMSHLILIGLMMVIVTLQTV